MKAKKDNKYSNGFDNPYNLTEDINMNQDQLVMTATDKTNFNVESSMMRQNVNQVEDEIARPMLQFMNIPGQTCIS